MKDLRIEKSRGFLYRQWNFPEPRAVLLLIHGLGGHGLRWEYLAGFFLKNNISSYAMELRGFGETEDLKGHVSSFGVYFEDVYALCDIIKSENPGKKIFLIGESMGGLISFLLAVFKADLFSGLVCISPAFKSILKFTPLDYVKVFFSLCYNPKRQFNVPFTSEMCTRDIEYQKKMDSDYKEHRQATSKLLFNILVAQRQSRLLKDKVKIPVLFLLSGEDSLVDSQAAEEFFGCLKVKDKAMITYPDMRHALSIDLGKEKVFEDILKWVQPRI